MANITTTGSGDWMSTTPGAPWPGGVVPDAADNVTIAAGHNVTNVGTILILTGNIKVYGTLTLGNPANANTGIEWDGGSVVISPGGTIHILPWGYLFVVGGYFSAANKSGANVATLIIDAPPVTPNTTAATVQFTSGATAQFGNGAVLVNPHRILCDNSGIMLQALGDIGSGVYPGFTLTLRYTTECKYIQADDSVETSNPAWIGDFTMSMSAQDSDFEWDSTSPANGAGGSLPLVVPYRLGATILNTVITLIAVRSGQIAWSFPMSGTSWGYGERILVATTFRRLNGDSTFTWVTRILRGQVNAVGNADGNMPSDVKQWLDNAPGANPAAALAAYDSNNGVAKQSTLQTVNASTFTGQFPASVLAKAPTGGSVISQTPPIVPGEMKVFQYGAFVQPGAGIPQQIGVTDCKGNPISLAGRTIEILATSPANRQHVLWKWTTADALTIVGANSNVIQIDADNTNSQTAGDFLLFAWDVTGGTRTAIPEASVRLVVLPAPQPQ